MNTEEKAKAYNEALEKAKKELKACGSLNCDAARQIFRFFPQLRESEDERIRKEIISALKFANDGGVYDKHIAYLEKKKKEEGYEAIPVESTLEYKLGFKAGKESEKQKEKKPAEWSEEDEEKRDDIVKIIEYSTTIPAYGKTGILKLSKEYKKELTDFLKSLPLNLKKKNEDVAKVCSNEWSEEDDMLMDELESYILYDKEFNDEQKSWRIKRLKSLRPQPKEELARMLQVEYNKGKETGEREGYTKGYNKGYKDARWNVQHCFKFWKPDIERPLETQQGADRSIGNR